MNVFSLFGRGISISTLSLLVGLAWFAPGAQASQVTSASTTACVVVDSGSCTNSDTLRVDQPFGLGVSFVNNQPLMRGNAIYVRGPVGTVFTRTSAQLEVELSGIHIPESSSEVMDGGRTIGFVIPNHLDTTYLWSGMPLAIKIGYFADKIKLPATPGTVQFSIWTSSDLDPREADDPLTSTVGLPATVSTVDSPEPTVVGQGFDSPVTTKLTDSRGNAIAGQEIEFSTSTTGAGGSFAGGADIFSDETDADGEVTTPEIKANTTAGAWDLALTGPGTVSGNVPMENLPDQVDSIDLNLDGDSLPADGQTTLTATASGSDEFGNPTDPSTIDLEVASDGPIVSSDGVDGDAANFTLRASKKPGQFSVKAIDASVEPSVSDTKTLTQTVLPATSTTLQLSPASIPADNSSVAVATVKLTNRLGEPATGDQVTLTSSGDQQIGPATESPEGTFTFPLTAGLAVGDSTLTAVAESDPAVKATATLTQTALPSPPGPVAPKVKIHSGPKGKIKKGRVTFRFGIASGQGTGFQCRLDRRKWATCKSPKTLNVKRGRHTFWVRAVGQGGKPGPAVKWLFRRVR